MTLVALACCLVLLLLLMLLAGVWLGRLSSSQSQRANMAIKLVGYSNAPSGKRFAFIGVTNLGSTKIYVYTPRIQVPDPSAYGGVGYYLSPSPASASALLVPGNSQTFVFPVPTSGAKWRPAFWVYDDYGIKFLKRFPSRNMPLQEEGDWIENK